MIIADHHQIEGEEKPGSRLLHLNPLKIGIQQEISGSGMSYILARGLSSDHKDLSEIAIIGAIGDSQTGPIGSGWGVLGLNREILRDSEETSKIRVSRGLRIWGRHTRPLHKALEYSIDPYIPGVSGTESGAVKLLQDIGIPLKREDGSWRSMGDLSVEETKNLASAIIMERMKASREKPEAVFGEIYELADKEHFSDASEFATLMNACGKTKKGYMGVALCLNDGEASSEAEGILEGYRKELGKAMSWLGSNSQAIRPATRANYLFAGGFISENIISNIVTMVYSSSGLSDKPIVAMADAEDGRVKVSARATDSLVKAGVNLKEIMLAASRSLGGEGGGHIAAAGAVIPKGSEEGFMLLVEEHLMKLHPGGTGLSNAYKDLMPTDENEKASPGSQPAPGTGQVGRSAEAGSGGEAPGIGAEQGINSSGGKEMERKGLVRYFNS